MSIIMNALGAETPWLPVIVTQKQIDALCSCLEDYNPMFLDEEAAAHDGGEVAPPTSSTAFATSRPILFFPRRRSTFRFSCTANR